MPLATNPNGSLAEIANCSIQIQGGPEIKVRSIPEMSDSKSASYNDESIMGRSFPLKTFSHGENRVISWDIPFYVLEDTDIDLNLSYLYALESAVYPQEGDGTDPYYPPPLCTIQCGKLFGMQPLCCILRSYSTRFPSDVAYDPDSMLPYKFTVQCQFEAVYPPTDLPGSSRILSSGR